MTALSQLRASDRIAMAADTQALALALGASAVIRPGYLNKRELCVDIAGARGLSVTVSFNGNTPQSEPDIWVLSWHIDSRADPGQPAIADRFAPNYGVNRHQFQKATHVVRGYATLLAQIERSLKMLANGTAFDTEREAALVLKHGTQADEQARFAAYRAEETLAKAAAS